jgi:hypothetical protein
MLMENLMNKSRFSFNIVGLSALFSVMVCLATGWLLLTNTDLIAQAKINRKVYVNSPGKLLVGIGRKTLEAKLIEKVNPIYPKQVLEKPVKEGVRLHVIVNEDGLVWKAIAIKSGHALLNSPAVRNVNVKGTRCDKANGTHPS